MALPAGLIEDDRGVDVGREPGGETVGEALSNIPEELSSAVGMRRAGRSARYIFGLWGGIALVCGFASWLGFTTFSGFPPEVIAAVMAVAAGAILAMLVDTMIPEAFEVAHDFAGLITVVGFLISFMLSKLGG